MKDFIHIARWKSAADWEATSGRHLHDHTEIIVVTGGGFGAWIDGMEVEAYRGDAFCYRPGVEHREWALGQPSEFILIATGGKRELPEQPYVRRRDNRILILSEWLLEERDAHDSARHHRQASLLDALLSEFMRPFEQSPSAELKCVRTYMRDNLAQALTVGDLAGRLSMSRYHFVRWYKRQTGTTPIQDLRRMRIDAACDLMRVSDAPLKAIAAQTGFSDEYYFSKTFRSYTGLPPGKWRRRY